MVNFDGKTLHTVWLVYYMKYIVLNSKNPASSEGGGVGGSKREGERRILKREVGMVEERAQQRKIKPPPTIFQVCLEGAIHERKKEVARGGMSLVLREGEKERKRWPRER